jgi:outer membrane immunogenic protein
MHWSTSTPVFGLVGAGFAATALAAGAHAADLGGRPPPYDPMHAASTPLYGAHSWTGFYAGMQAGYAWARNDITAMWGQASGPQEIFEYTSRGAIGGLHFGYNRQVNRLVVGIEADLETGGLTGSNAGTVGAIHTTSLDWIGSLRGRMGFVTGNSLLYVTGGLAYGSVSTEQYQQTSLAPFSIDTQRKTGWTAGAGLEHALASNLTIRMEYRYTDLGEVSYYSPKLWMRETSEITSHAVRGGISFKF